MKNQKQNISGLNFEVASSSNNDVHNRLETLNSPYKSMDKKKIAGGIISQISDKITREFVIENKFNSIIDNFDKDFKSKLKDATFVEMIPNIYDSGDQSISKNIFYAVSTPPNKDSISISLFYKEYPYKNVLLYEIILNKKNKKMTAVKGIVDTFTKREVVDQLSKHIFSI